MALLMSGMPAVGKAARQHSGLVVVVAVHACIARIRALFFCFLLFVIKVVCCVVLLYCGRGLQISLTYSMALPSEMLVKT